MKELSIEEKARRYDEAMKKAGERYNEEYTSTLERSTLAYVFPELKESEDERIRKEMIEIIGNEAKEFPSSIIASKANSWLAWLEKQGEHANFRNEIQVGDKVTRNEDGMLVNLSHLKRVAKPAKEYNIRGIGSKHAEGKLKELIEKQCKQKLDEISLIDSIGGIDCTTLIDRLKSLKDRCLSHPQS